VECFRMGNRLCKTCADGSLFVYKNNILAKHTLADGSTIRLYNEDGYLESIETALIHSFFQGEEENLIRIEFNNGTIHHFENGIMVCKEFLDGVKNYYKEERLCRIDDTHGNSEIFNTTDGSLIQIDRFDGVKVLFQKGLLQHKLYPCGMLKTYTTEEVHSSSTYPDGCKKFFENKKMVRMEHADGCKKFFEGDRLVHMEHADGCKKFFEGDRMVRMEHADGSKKFFKNDRLIRAEYPEHSKLDHVEPSAVPNAVPNAVPDAVPDDSNLHSEKYHLMGYANSGNTGASSAGGAGGAGGAELKRTRRE
jgi:hypothetical protein